CTLKIINKAQIYYISSHLNPVYHDLLQHNVTNHNKHSNYLLIAINTYIKNFITDNKHTCFISYRIPATVITQVLPTHIDRRRLSTGFHFQQSRT
ncbi:hypothetical protein K0A31_22555, partial [Salmonella enterica subsp. enterica serovar Montevideo]|nr:hypothetical protein [Salmonella enterica subsp. enterica serovar Montevideo]